MGDVMTLKVIGTGFGRTGTDSMRTALNMLGFGRTHHMLELFDHPDEETLWQELAGGATPDWDALFNGYSACVDWPSAFYWRELINIYPDAKVLLTWRTPESWWTSFEKTILQVIQSTDDPNSLGVALIAEQVFGGRPDDREHAIKTYENNVDAVIATVPEDRLLVYKIGDGWGPLCAHLGVDVPTEEYPNRNTKTDFFDHVEKAGKI